MNHLQFHGWCGAFAAVSALCGSLSSGCGLIAGVHDVVLEEGSGNSGGSGGGTTDASGSGGSGATGDGGTAGAGGIAVTCKPAGDLFEVFPPADVLPGHLFVLAGADPMLPRAHVFYPYDESGGHVAVRTVKAAGQSSSPVTWDAPPGKWSFRQGFSESSAISSFGVITTVDGPKVARVRFMMDADKEVDKGSAPELIELDQPSDCASMPDADIDHAIGAVDGSNLYYVATFDGCVAGTRRLYRGTPAGVELLREGATSDPTLALFDYVRSGPYSTIVFSDGISSYYSSGDSVAELKAVSTVALGASQEDQTYPLAIAPLPDASFAFWWLVSTKNMPVPATLYAAKVTGAALGSAGLASTYQGLKTYDSIGALGKWSRPSAAEKNVVVGAIVADSSAVRFSLFAPDGKPLVLDQVAATGTPGQYLDASAAQFGADGIIIAWVSVNGSTPKVQAQIFTCM